MDFVRPYDFDDEEALARLRALADYWDKKHGITMRWDGPSAQVAGKVKGVKFSGTIRVSDGKVVADIKAGFLAEKLGGKKYVVGKVEDYLDPTKTVDELRALVP
jgi:hypothetical protein